MSDYISRADLMNHIENEAREWGEDYDAEQILGDVEDFPAADVRPVVRGKWESVMLDHERMGCRPTAHYCSECLQITWFRTFYCPNCGADMRK